MWHCCHPYFSLLTYFCLTTRRSFCHCAWTSWLKFSPVTSSMCQKRRWCLRQQCCGWTNAPLVNKVLKRSYCTFEFNVALCKEQFHVLGAVALLFVDQKGWNSLVVISRFTIPLIMVVGIKLLPIQTFSPRSSSISDCLSSAHITSTMWLSLWTWWRRTQAARDSSQRPRTTFCLRTVVVNFIAPERDRAGPQVNTTPRSPTFLLFCIFMIWMHRLIT